MIRQTDARSAAFRMLQCIRNGKTIDDAITTEVNGLDPRDRRLAHEIAAGVLRNRRLLDRMIDVALSRPDRRVVQDLRDILRIGAYQLKYLDRVPSYAGVAATVDLARVASGSRGAGFVNAVLRRVSESTPIDITELTTAERYSHPDWLVERWLGRFGEEQTSRLLEHNNRKPSIVIQPVRWSVEQMRNELENANIPFRAHGSGFGTIVQDADIHQLPGYGEGAFIVQDPAQRRLLQFCQVPEGASVWDACAAPGGKAITLATQCRVLCSDSSRDRLYRLTENLHRTATDALTLVADAAAPPFRTGRFDVVLVDAPCSATGTMARHPDARWSLTPKKIRNVSQVQRRILDGVADAVRPGGLLLYLTCSLEKEENEVQVDQFLARHQEYERIEPDCIIFPVDEDSDGGFGARMRRVG